MVLWLSLAHGTTFTLAPSGPHAGASSAGWGVGVGDVDHDGWLDLLTLPARSGGNDVRLLQGGPTGFVDRTSSWAPGLRAQRDYSRGVVIADLTGDGRRDIVVSGMRNVGVFARSSGTTSIRFGGIDDGDPVYTESDATMAGLPHEITFPDLNLEGISPFDSDGDGVLDLQLGFRSMRILDPAGLGDVTFGEDGLPGELGYNDFLSMEDIDGDQRVDLVVGREGDDVFFQGADGRFVADPTVDLPGYNVKGAVLLCDFDDDGDLDLFRAGFYEGNSAPPLGDDNVILLHGPNGWVSRGNPGIDLARGAMSGQCADLDNDGDLDLVVGYHDGGLEVLRNQGGGAFVPDGGGIPTAWTGGTRGIALADFDRDGAIDVYVQVNGAPNRLYVNQSTSDTYVQVELLANIGTCDDPVLVDDVHGQVRVARASGTPVTGQRVLYGTSGTGVSGHNPIHVGLGGVAPTETLQVEIRPGTLRPNGEHEWVSTPWVVPSDHPRQTVTLRTDDPDMDGIPNDLEGLQDFDGDGLANRVDRDADGDGLLDADEVGDPCAPLDSDQDGKPDYLDTDADADGDPDQTDCAPTDPDVFTGTWYIDDDGDGFGDGTGFSVCGSTVGLAPVDGDCDDADETVHPGADELCAAGDQDCDGSDDVGAIDRILAYPDVDTDGFGAGSGTLACTVGPDQSDVGGDCDDLVGTVSPAAIEVCDGIDNDCDDLVDDDSAADASVWYVDADQDGHGGSTTVLACTQPANAQPTETDCDDTLATSAPGLPELCDNLVDDDCDGEIDEGQGPVDWYADGDGDGVGAGPVVLTSCTGGPGLASTTGDCDDDDASIRPGAVETCDGIDTNCTLGEIDAVDQTILYQDLDGDGFGTIRVPDACGIPMGTAVLPNDCDDTDPSVRPQAPEACNQIDDNCDGGIDNAPTVGALELWPDGDGDGHGLPTESRFECSVIPGYALPADDCDDTEPLAWTDATEVCDGVDNDCDGQLDDLDPGLDPASLSIWFADVDGDGVGGDLTFEACLPPEGFVASGGDCDDEDAVRFPGAVDIPDNGLDEDCSGADTLFDQDGDGVPDSEEANGDTDGDGVPDIFDPDSDDDGVIDGAEPSADARQSDGTVARPVPSTPDYGGCSTIAAPTVGSWFSRRR